MGFTGTKLVFTFMCVFCRSCTCSRQQDNNQDKTCIFVEHLRKGVWKELYTSIPLCNITVYMAMCGILATPPNLYNYVATLMTFQGQESWLQVTRIALWTKSQRAHWVSRLRKPPCYSKLVVMAHLAGYACKLAV